MKLANLTILIVVFSLVCCMHTKAQEDISPLDIEFRRQATQRFMFDQNSAIPLSVFNPAKIVNQAVEYPAIPVSGGTTSYELNSGEMTISAETASESALWIGGFNPYGTYDLSFSGTEGNSGKAGIEFATPDHNKRLSVLAGFNGKECTTIQWQVNVNGSEKQNEIISLEEPVKGPFILRVQVVGTKVNILVEQNEVTRAVGAREFIKFIDLRRKVHIRSFEFRLFSSLDSGEAITVKEARASLSSGMGQADLCAITYKDGSPLLDQGRLWFTMTIRGRHFPQGVFSMNPSVFDIRLEGVIVFDRGDGLLRNELASHIYYDEDSDEWRGLTVGMSSHYDSRAPWFEPEKEIKKGIWAISSKKDPRFGFSVMKSKPIVLPNSSEDPHIIYDAEAEKWRVLVCAWGEGKMKGQFPAALYESDSWDGPYNMIAGPVEVNSTGCLIQKIGSQYYAIFGSSDRKFYVYSYPDLRQLGSLNMFRPPWDDKEGTRCWPNVIPLPDGYPAPYISLTMDRVVYKGLESHIYGALYLYNGHPVNGEREIYEYETDKNQF